MSETTLKQAQADVDAWISQWEEGYWPPLANLARLTEEVGELARAINVAEGPKPAKEGESSSVSEEMGDVLFVLLALANQLDVDLQTVLETTLEKYDVRDADRFTKK